MSVKGDLCAALTTRDITSTIINVIKNSQLDCGAWAPDVQRELAESVANALTTHEQTRDLLMFILNHADDPDFAYKYADQEENRGTAKHNEMMLEYWNVVKFLKSTV